MITFNDFKQGSVYPPVEDANRVQAISRNRQLYNNDIKQLGVGDDEVQTLNLFRKAVDIYVEFLLSAGVVIKYDDLISQQIVDNLKSHFLDLLYLVNTDSRRYGVGVVTICNKTGLFQVYEPDQWFMIRDEAGVYVGDVLAEFAEPTFEQTREQKSEPTTYKTIKFVINDYTVNKQTIEYRKLDGGTIGEITTETITTDIVGKQVITLFNGYPKGQEGVSVFDDIKTLVGDMIKIKGRLSQTLEKNLRPHLAVPSGILQENESGTIDINTEGMVIPLNPDDKEPFYLQWDSNSDAAKFMIEEHWKTFFALTSIPKMIIDGSNGAATSGEALRRLLFPFLSSLAKLEQSNIVFVKKMLILLSNSRLSNGLAQLYIRPPEIMFDYGKIFMDADAETPEVQND